MIKLDNNDKFVNIAIFYQESTKFLSEYFCEVFNNLQDYYLFTLCNKSFKEIDNPTREKLRNLVLKNEEKSDFLNIFIHSHEDDYNWFGTFPEESISLITVHGWSLISNEIQLIHLIGSSIIGYIQELEINKHRTTNIQSIIEDLFRQWIDTGEKNEPDKDEDILIHFHSENCLNDFCQNKEDKLRKIMSGYICRECSNIWNRRLKDKHQQVALTKMLDFVRTDAILSSSDIISTSIIRETIYYIELFLHNFVEKALNERFDEEWWVKGVNENIRMNIAETYERNDCIGDKFQYTYLIQLSKIWHKHFGEFSKKYPFNKWKGEGKEKMKKELELLNRLRNKVMHAPRKYCPVKEDLELLMYFKDRIFNFKDSAN